MLFIGLTKKQKKLLFLRSTAVIIIFSLLETRIETISREGKTINIEDVTIE